MKKNHISILIDAENSFDKIQPEFMTKILRHLRREENFLNFIKSIYLVMKDVFLLKWKQGACSHSYTITQYGAASSTHCHQVKKKRQTDHKGRTETTTSCRWHYDLCRKS